MKIPKKTISIAIICVLLVTVLSALLVYAPPATPDPPTQGSLQEMLIWTLGNITEIDNRLDVIAIGRETDADPGNHGLADIVVQVTCNGLGVPDLEDNEFELVLLKAPVGTHPFVIADILSFPMTPGNYVIQIEPDLGYSWLAGEHIWTLKVTDGTKVGNTLVDMIVVEGDFDTWMGDIEDYIDDSFNVVGDRLDDIESGFLTIEEQLDDIDEKIDNIPTFFSVEETISDPFFIEDWELYRFSVTSSEDFKVRSFYFSIDYGEGYTSNPVEVEFGAISSPYDCTFMFDPEFDHASPEGTRFDIDHEPWEHPYGDTRLYGFDSELLSYLEVDTDVVYPAGTNFELYMAVIDGDNGDETIYVNVIVETAQDAIVDIWYDDGLAPWS